jgi:hypothetical protein
MYPPPQHPPPQHPPPQYPAPQLPPAYGHSYPPGRPATPRVVGILGLIFAVIGLGSSLLFTFGPLSDLQRAQRRVEYALSHLPDTGRPDVGAITSWLYAWLAVSVVLFAVHLAGSILAIAYKRAAPKLLTGYAVGAIILLVIDLVMVQFYVPKGFYLDGSVTISHTVYSGIALIWPVLVLALINTRKSREACSA